MEIHPEKFENIKIKKAARAVIMDGDKFAVISVRNGEYFKIPGGGLEDNEDEKQGAQREAMEESGCEIELIDTIGENEFIDPEDRNKIHHSICFLARKKGESKNTNFDEWERSNSMCVLWMTYEEALQKFEQVKTEDQFGKLINKRDMEFLKSAKFFLDNIK